MELPMTPPPMITTCALLGKEFDMAG